jgi:uncharacterized membrane protein YcjF (UPF0283 family)
MSGLIDIRDWKYYFTLHILRYAVILIGIAIIGYLVWKVFTSTDNIQFIQLVASLIVVIVTIVRLEIKILNEIAKKVKETTIKTSESNGSKIFISQSLRLYCSPKIKEVIYIHGESRTIIATCHKRAC